MDAHGIDPAIAGRPGRSNGASSGPDAATVAHCYATLADAQASPELKASATGYLERFGLPLVAP